VSGSLENREGKSRSANVDTANRASTACSAPRSLGQLRPKHIGPAEGQGQALMRKSQDFTQNRRKVHPNFK